LFQQSLFFQMRITLGADLSWVAIATATLPVAGFSEDGLQATGQLI
jgi:hypothetical protein